MITYDDMTHLHKFYKYIREKYRTLQGYRKWPYLVMFNMKIFVKKNKYKK